MWDWNKPAVRNELPHPNLVERALLYFMQVPQAKQRIECLKQVSKHTAALDTHLVDQALRLCAVCCVLCAVCCVLGACLCLHTLR